MNARRLLSSVSANSGALSLLSTLLLVVFLAVGFAWQTPAQRLGALATTDTLIMRRQDSLHAEHRAIVNIVRVLAVDVCLRRSAEQTQMMQLPCAELLHPHDDTRGK